MDDPLLEQVESFIDGNHPQAAALLIFSLSPETAGTILSELPVMTAVDLAERIYRTGEVDRESHGILLSRFEELCPDPARLEKERNDLLLEVLAACGYLRQRDILRELASTCSIYLKYGDVRMMEDLLKVDDAILGTIIPGIDQRDLTLALRVEDENLRIKLLSFLPDESVSDIRSDLEWGGAVPLEEVERACLVVIARVNEMIRGRA
jgi:flagellar motor switch protein FliG